jgi:deazaflavin-dependent oxidoreductase (nitroreductase family)
MNAFDWLRYKAIPWFTSLGLTKGTITLEVRGRSSGRPVRVSLTQVRLGDARYLVSLGGESQWVRNVRAAGGQALLVSRNRMPVKLSEVPIEARAPILLAYVSQRAFTHSGAQSARHFFGLATPPTLEDMQHLANRYPVFQILPLS